MFKKLIRWALRDEIEAAIKQECNYARDMFEINNGYALERELYNKAKTIALEPEIIIAITKEIKASQL